MWDSLRDRSRNINVGLPPLTCSAFPNDLQIAPVITVLPYLISPPSIHSLCIWKRCLEANWFIPQDKHKPDNPCTYFQGYARGTANALSQMASHGWCTYAKWPKCISRSATLKDCSVCCVWTDHYKTFLPFSLYLETIIESWGWAPLAWTSKQPPSMP